MALNHTLHFWHSFANHYYETQHVVSIMRFIISKPQGWQKVISVCQTRMFTRFTPKWHCMAPSLAKLQDVFSTDAGTYIFLLRGFELYSILRGMHKPFSVLELQNKMTKPILGSVAVSTGQVGSSSLQNEVLLTPSAGRS